MLQNYTKNKLEEFLENVSFDTSVTVNTHVHRLIHEGKMFMVPHIFLAVAPGATIYLRHYGATTKYLNSILDINTVGEWTFTSYSGTTYTADGTEITPVNRKSDSTEVLESTFEYNPVIDVLGTPRLPIRFGYADIPAKASTSEFNEALESVFAPGTDVLIGLKNESVSKTYYLSILFNVYEDENGNE